MITKINNITVTMAKVPSMFENKMSVSKSILVVQ